MTDLDRIASQLERLNDPAAEYVSMIGNRACIAELTVEEHFGPELRRWVRENCEPAMNADVWLLP